MNVETHTVWKTRDSIVADQIDRVNQSTESLIDNTVSILDESKETGIEKERDR